MAALVASVIGVGGALAWPSLLPEAWRPGLVVAYVLALPLLHWALQRMPAAQAVSPAARPGRLPVVEMAPAQPVETAPLREQNLEDALFTAARAGRVERALELLDTGADPHALPVAGQRDQRSLATLAAVLPDLRLLRALITQGMSLIHI